MESPIKVVPVAEALGIKAAYEAFRVAAEAALDVEPAVELLRRSVLQAMLLISILNGDADEAAVYTRLVLRSNLPAR